MIWKRAFFTTAVAMLIAEAAAAQTLIPLHKTIAEIRVTPDSVTLQSGDSVRFSAVAYDDAGAEIPGVQLLWLVDPYQLGALDSLGNFAATGVATEGAIIAVPASAAETPSDEPPVIGVARVRVTAPPLLSLRVEGPPRVVAGSYVPLRVIGANRQGTTDVEDALWRSSAPKVASVEAGYLEAKAPGKAVLTAVKDGVESTLAVQVTRNRVHDLRIVCAGCAPAVVPTSGSAGQRAGRTEVREITVPVGEAVRLEARPGGKGQPLPVRWWLEGEGGLLDQQGNFVADTPGRFVVMAQLGSVSQRLSIEAMPRQKRGVFRVVGRGPVANPRVSDLWVFEGVDGRDYAYTGSIGGDQVKIWDVTDPTRPMQTDSLVVDARVVNDVNLNQSRKLGVLTREGASDRKNGIVLFDASDPAHPKVISEYSETVTSGVHNAFFDGDYIYATNDGTRALHIISARDPARPVEVARWEVRPGETNKYLHDVIVQEGLAYLSYWDDGLVILDVGNGVKRGSPEKPAFVSRIAYPEGHTHTAWRWKNYVFTGDEIFGGPPVTPDGGVPGGFLHVIDVSDLERPVEVAKYEVPGAGAHNIWMDEENETLFVSYYNAGVRALDVSGSLRGDLMKQGRELGFFLTGEPDPTLAAKPNSPMNWGPQLHKGNVFSTDMNSGLWVLRFDRGEKVTTASR